jgi:hypothetical protein
MQGKYAIYFIPIRAPHMLFRSSREKKARLCLSEESYTIERFRVPFEEYKVSYAFLVKTLKTPSY